jgi:hypothetical protein
MSIVLQPSKATTLDLQLAPASTTTKANGANKMICGAADHRSGRHRSATHLHQTDESPVLLGKLVHYNEQWRAQECQSRYNANQQTERPVPPPAAPLTG